MRSFVPAVVARADVAAPPSGPESGRAEEGGTLPPSSSPPSLRPPRSSPSLRPAGNSVQPRCARASRPREYERSCATQRIRKIFPRGAARGRIRPPAWGRRGGGGGRADSIRRAAAGGPPCPSCPSCPSWRPSIGGPALIWMSEGEPLAAARERAHGHVQHGHKLCPNQWSRRG